MSSDRKRFRSNSSDNQKVSSFLNKEQEKEYQVNQRKKDLEDKFESFFGLCLYKDKIRLGNRLVTRSALPFMPLFTEEEGSDGQELKVTDGENKDNNKNQ